jgi:hypothetical protein
VIRLGVEAMGKRQQPASHFLKMGFQETQPQPARFSNKHENDEIPDCFFREAQNSREFCARDKKL